MCLVFIAVHKAQRVLFHTKKPRINLGISSNAHYPVRCISPAKIFLSTNLLHSGSQSMRSIHAIAQLGLAIYTPQTYDPQLYLTNAMAIVVLINAETRHFSSSHLSIKPAKPYGLLLLAIWPI